MAAQHSSSSTWNSLVVATAALAGAGCTAALAARLWSQWGASTSTSGSPLTPSGLSRKPGLAANGAQVCASCAALAAPTRRRCPQDPRPREGYLSWDDYFMATAFLTSLRSKDPNKQVGACLVNQDQIIVGVGYNGFPRGCADARLPWAKAAASGDLLDTKYPYVCHAEMNAILNKNIASLAGTKLYVTMFPCNECAKLLIQAGVREVIYYENKVRPAGEGSAGGPFRPDQAYAASRRLLAMAGVRLRQHVPQRSVYLAMAPPTPAG